MLVLGYGLGNCMQPLLLILQSRRAAARHRRSDGVGDVLPPDRRHARRRDVPVGAVRQVGGHIRRGPRDRVADAGVPAGRADIRSTPLDQQFAQSLQHPTPRGGSSPRCRTTRRSSRSSRPCSRTRSRSASPSRWTRCSCSPGCVGAARLPDPAADAEGRAAGHVGECRRQLRGGADGTGDRAGLSRARRRIGSSPFPRGSADATMTRWLLRSSCATPPNASSSEP